MDSGAFGLFVVAPEGRASVPMESLRKRCSRFMLFYWTKGLINKLVQTKNEFKKCFLQALEMRL